jgi:hypothetical protein
MHVDHCIEALRISLMCHSDPTPYLIITDSASRNQSGLQSSSQVQELRSHARVDEEEPAE